MQRFPRERCYPLFVSRDRLSLLLPLCRVPQTYFAFSVGRRKTFACHQQQVQERYLRFLYTVRQSQTCVGSIRCVQPPPLLASNLELETRQWSLKAADAEMSVHSDGTLTEATHHEMEQPKKGQDHCILF